MIDLRYVKKLLEMIDASSVNTIEITSDKGMKIRLSKAANRQAHIPAAPAQQAAVGREAAPAAGQAATGSAAHEPPARAEPPKTSYLEVKSPMVGTYYAAPEPGAKPYLS